TYMVTDLGTLGGLNSHPLGVNNAGQVVGVSDTATQGNYSQGFLYSNGTMDSVGPSSSVVTAANAINNNGQVTGYFSPTPHNTEAFLYADGVFTDLGTINSGTGQVSLGYGIKTDGTIMSTANQY